jgi:hypothetical protein
MYVCDDSLDSMYEKIKYKLPGLISGIAASPASM